MAPFQIQKFIDYIWAFYAIIIVQLNRQRLNTEAWNRSISVSTKGYAEPIRRLSEKDKAILLESGRQGVWSFLNKQAGLK